MTDTAVDPLAPTPALLAKLGSALVHAEEAASDDGCALDAIALRALLTDPEVTGWLARMREMALIPEKRQ